MIRFASPIATNAAMSTLSALPSKSAGPTMPAEPTTLAELSTPDRPSMPASSESTAMSIPPHEPGAGADAVRERRRRLAGLGDDIARLSAHIEATLAQLFDLIRVFDQSQGWHEEGFRSCAAWLSWRTGIGTGAARERVRVARALGELPHLREALGRGELSYSTARAITRVATPENDAELVEAARFTTAADMERLVSAWRVADRAEDERERHARRRLTLIPEVDGSWSIRGRLDPEVGAVLQRALQAAGEALYPRESKAASEDEDLETTPEARRADAMGLVAEAALADGLGSGTEPVGGAKPETDAESEARPVVSRADRFQVVLHVSAETLSGSTEDGSDISAERPAGSIDDGPHVSAETSRRLACDAGVVKMEHGRDGSLLNVGRRRRTVSTPLRRALARRDGGCRFPGCRARFCDAHHVEHWADGGETSLENLVLLCRYHHRRVHEDGWRVNLMASGEARFVRPDGRRFPRLPARPSLPGDAKRALVRRNEERGLEIDAWTPTPRWTGERLDVDWALFTLR